MNTAQFKQACSLAFSAANLPPDTLEIFDGFGLRNFRPVFVSLNQVASLIRWQCSQLNGGIDSEALGEVLAFGRKRFQIVAILAVMLSSVLLAPTASARGTSGMRRHYATNSVIVHQGKQYPHSQRLNKGTNLHRNR